MLNGRLTIETEWAGQLIVAVEEIKQIHTDDSFQIIHLDGSKTEAQLDSSTELTAIRSVRQIASSDLFNGLDSWEKRIEASLVQASGNTDSQLFLARISSDHKRAKVEHLVNLGVSIDVADDITQKEQIEFNYGYRRFFQENWYSGLNVDTFRDPIKNVDNRVSLAASMGRRFWEHTHGLLTSELGLSQLFETLTSESEWHPALRWALDYKKVMQGGKLEGFHNHRLLTIPEDNRGFVLDSSSGFRFLVNKRLDVNMRIDAHHESMPAPDRHETDLTYVAGLGLSF